jgi:8-oxo-dGTP pyrophosphatase MutT (NUDIX family)
MPIPDFILELRAMVGHHHLWLPGVTAVVRRGDEILLVQRADNGAWTPVTGIPEPGEEPAVAALREVREETGVTARVDRLASTWVHGPITHANGDEATYLDLTFACTWIAGDAHVADDESRDVAWVRRDDLPGHGVSHEMLRRIDAALSEDASTRFESGG